MIDPKDYTKQEKVYLYRNKLYKILSYCEEPSIEMIPVDGGEVISFGISGLRNRDFEEVPGLLIDFRGDVKTV